MVTTWMDKVKWVRARKVAVGGIQRMRRENEKEGSWGCYFKWLKIWVMKKQESEMPLHAMCEDGEVYKGQIFKIMTSTGLLFSV